MNKSFNVIALLGFFILNQAFSRELLPIFKGQQVIEKSSTTQKKFEFSEGLQHGISIIETDSETGIDEAWIRRILGKRARVVLASGSLEPVLDSDGGEHSVFARYLIKVLEENRSVMTGDQIYDNLKKYVVANSEQTPVFSSIRGVGHEFGDFLFVRK